MPLSSSSRADAQAARPGSTGRSSGGDDGLRTIAIDWSGAAVGAERTIWLAEARRGVLVRLENGRTREAIADHLITEAARTPELIVGLDFAFSFPEWFLAQRGLDAAPALWALAAEAGEGWLAACEAPFWGRAGKRRPLVPDEFRQADRAVPVVGGIRPKSAFQIGGAGAVGTGSVRGMPILHRLRSAGFAIWPFDAPHRPCVVEIYPRVLTGPVVKRSAEAREAYLDRYHPFMDEAVRGRAASGEDAFDAAVSALVMDAARDELATLPVVRDERSRREGRIWFPTPSGDR